MSTAYALETCPQHLQSGHPEHPDRLRLVPNLLDRLSLRKIESRPATTEEVGLVHTPDLLARLRRQCAAGPAVIDPAPTYVTSASFDCALMAAGATLACAAAIVDGDAKNGFSIIRPPGHHAEPDRAMGFCLFNNVAIAAAWALTRGLRRVAIIDFDAHHGNGTQAAFLAEEPVAYLSTHQWGIYPGTGWVDDAPDARGRIVNVALPEGCGDKVFRQVAEQIIAPFVRGFSPELILVSAGFDGHWNDPLTSLGLSTAGFHALSRELVALADAYSSGRILFILEGGYDPRQVANGIGAAFAALAGAEFALPGDASPHDEPDVSSHLAHIRALHSFSGIQ